MLPNKKNYTDRMQLLLLALFTASLTVVLHGIGTEHNWYWVYEWFDVITHLLGGFSLGLLAALLYGKTSRCIPLALGTVLVFIIGWEVFEVLFVGTMTNDPWYGANTMKDIIVGLFGAYTAAMVYQRDAGDTTTT